MTTAHSVNAFVVHSRGQTFRVGAGDESLPLHLLWDRSRVSLVFVSVDKML